MSARLLRLAVVALLAASLSSCWLVYSSVFPEFSSLVVDQVDLRAYLPADRDAEVRIACYDDGTTEFVFLLVRGSSVGERLLIFDEQLELRYEATDTAADDLFSVWSPIATNSAGEVFVGLLAFPPGLGAPATLLANNLDWSHTLYDPSVDELISVAPNGNILEFVTVPTSPDNARLFDTMSISATGGYGPINAGYSLRSDAAGLATADTVNGVVAGFIGTTATIRSENINNTKELVTSFGGYTFSVTQPMEQVHPVPSGVVVEHEDEGLYLTYYDDQGTAGPGIYYPRGDVRLTFSMAGEHFYLLERERNAIMKVSAWW